MNTRCFLFICIFATLPLSVSAQRHITLPLRAGAPDWLPFTDHLAKELGLPPLTTATPGVNAEIRVWDGFGIIGTRAYVFRHGAGGWQVRAYDPDGAPDPINRTLPDSIDWSVRVAAALRAGLLSLQPTPRDSTSQFMVGDGRSFLVEWRVAGVYGAAGADNPQTFCTADDEQLLRVLRALTGAQLPCRPPNSRL
jgi:hypothetical protein